MASRLELHNEFIDVLGTANESESRVYFNTPESVKMSYPCIRYAKSGVDKHNANDKPYKTTNQYEGVVIDYDPDSEIADKILHRFSMCSLGRCYVADNLYHFPFTLYY